MPLPCPPTDRRCLGCPLSWDGGQPNDPNLYPIMVEIANTESKPKLRAQAQKIVKSVQDVEDKKQSPVKTALPLLSGQMRLVWALCGGSGLPL
ncbi:MAG: hypothetical protein QGG39_15785 [Candidatus Poribacteria bacterium]|nr:hypothetical protein [Candidatus Poribacteria bacterium]